MATAQTQQQPVLRRGMYYGEAESRAHLESLPPIPPGLGMNGRYLHGKPLCSRRTPMRED